MTSDLTIGLHTLKWQAYVVDMPDQCLLGSDFFIYYGVDIQLSKNSIMVMGEEIVATLQKTTSGTEVQVSCMSLKKCTVVLPNTIKYVMGKCAQDITGDVILQPSIKHPELLIPQTVVALEDQQTPVKLCNPTHRFVTLKKGCNLGHLKEVDGIFHEHATVDMEANYSIL